MARYSSTGAQRKAWDAYHQFECLALRKVAPKVPSATALLASRLLWARQLNRWDCLPILHRLLILPACMRLSMLIPLLVKSSAPGRLRDYQHHMQVLQARSLLAVAMGLMPPHDMLAASPTLCSHLC